MTTRTQELQELMHIIDNSLGIGLEEITENTDIDDYIERFIETFTIEFDMNDELRNLNESIGTSYIEKLNAI
jgi:hypothetical protein